MKKSLLTLLVIAIALNGFAQDVPGRHRMHRKPGVHGRPGKNLQQLNLTTGQKEQFRKERESFRKSMEDLKKKDDITVKEWRTRMEKLRTEHRGKMDKILTPEQKDKARKLREEERTRRQDMMKQRGDRMKSKLGLTADQSARMDQNRQEMMNKMKAIRENSSLSQDKKREQLREVMQKQREFMKGLLTDEQQKQFREMRAPRPPRHRGGPPPPPND
jgi:Spy/CpxP family protein refolding chaperone